MPKCALSSDERNPSEKVLRCGDQLTIRNARNTSYRLTDQKGDEMPKGAQLDSGALMIEFKPSAAQRSFQIRTPHALAAVRGTTWAVEVDADKTATLVISGVVEVRRPNAKKGVAPASRTRQRRDLRHRSAHRQTLGQAAGRCPAGAFRQLMRLVRPSGRILLTMVFLLLGIVWGGFIGSRQIAGTASVLDRLEYLTLDWRFLLAGEQAGSARRSDRRDRR